MFRTTVDMLAALKGDGFSAILFCSWRFQRWTIPTAVVAGTLDVTQIFQHRIACDGCTRPANDSSNSFFGGFFQIRFIFIVFHSLHQRNATPNPSSNRIDFFVHLLQQSALELVAGALVEFHLDTHNAGTHGLVM